MTRLIRGGLALGIPLLLAVATVGCGTGSSADPSTVVARVGGDAITKAMFAHELYVVGREQGPAAAIPTPPQFTGCIAHLKALDARSTSTGSKPPSVATLRGECRANYQGLETQALDGLIVDDWVSGGAVEEGASVSEREVQRHLKQEEKPSQAQLAKELAASGRTVADFARSIRVQLLGEGIRHALRERSEHLSQAQIASYYDTHRQLFGLPKRRDVEIVHAGSEAEAQKVKREIASGKSFASVVKTLPPPQPIRSTEGLAMEYEPGEYEEKPLDRAIFAARPHVLSGPVEIVLGYYVFEVTRTYPARPEPLAQAQAAIRRVLPKELYEQALAAFVGAWRARWTAKTDCLPGYVVAKCRQFKPAAPPGDPYSLD